MSEKVLKQDRRIVARSFKSCLFFAHHLLCGNRATTPPLNVVVIKLSPLYGFRQICWKPLAYKRIQHTKVKTMIHSSRYIKPKFLTHLSTIPMLSHHLWGFSCYKGSVLTWFSQIFVSLDNPSRETTLTCGHYGGWKQNQYMSDG